MTTYVIPTTYEEWVHCITVKCNIPLTPKFIRQRIAALGDANSPEAKTFARLYGEAHRVQIVEWYRRAAG